MRGKTFFSDTATGSVKELVRTVPRARRSATRDRVGRSVVSIVAIRRFREVGENTRILDEWWSRFFQFSWVLPKIIDLVLDVCPFHKPI